MHLPTERHREAWAIEERAPKTPDPPAGTSTPKSGPQSRSRKKASGGGGSSGGEILVVASRLKAYIKSQAGYNTSDSVLPVLSTALRKICDESIENARRAERQTVMDRDVPREPR